MIAAIDVGSNAVCLAIGSPNGRRKPELVENIRDPVRLGHDVFTRGVQDWRAVATSAMREELFQKENGSRKLEKPGEIIDELQALPVEQRGRTDVILPAAIVLHKGVKQAGTGWWCRSWRRCSRTCLE